MFTVRLSQAMESELEQAAKITRRSKGFLVKEALNRYLGEVKDLYLAMERLSNPKSIYHSTDEVKKQLGAS